MMKPNLEFLLKIMTSDNVSIKAIARCVLYEICTLSIVNDIEYENKSINFAFQTSVCNRIGSKGKSKLGCFRFICFTSRFHQRFIAPFTDHSIFRVLSKYSYAKCASMDVRNWNANGKVASK